MLPKCISLWYSFYLCSNADYTFKRHFGLFRGPTDNSILWIFKGRVLGSWKCMHFMVSKLFWQNYLTPFPKHDNIYPNGLYINMLFEFHFKTGCSFFVFFKWRQFEIGTDSSDQSNDLSLSASHAQLFNVSYIIHLQTIFISV